MLRNRETRLKFISALQPEGAPLYHFIQSLATPYLEIKRTLSRTQKVLRCLEEGIIEGGTWKDTRRGGSR